MLVAAPRRKLETGAAQERVARRGLRLRRERRSLDDGDRAYADELLTRREADVERRTAELDNLNVFEATNVEMFA